MTPKVATRRRLSQIFLNQEIKPDFAPVFNVQFIASLCDCMRISRQKVAKLATCL